MITIEDVRAVGEPRRTYNWEVDFGDNILKILCQECNFPVDNLVPRDVTQGNLQFSVYADRNLGILSLSFVEIDNGYITTWYNQWFNECIPQDGIVVPVGRTARMATVTELTLMKNISTSYRMLLVPINEAQFQRTEGGSGPVLIQLTMQILDIQLTTSGIQTGGKQKPAVQSKADIYSSMSSGGAALGPVGADGSGGFTSPNAPPPAATEYTGGDTITLPDGTLAPVTTASSVSGTAFPSLENLTDDMDFSTYTIPAHTVDDLKDSSAWSWWPGIGNSPGMNVPLPTGTTINVGGVEISLGLAKWRDSYPRITSSGGPYNTAGGAVNGSTFYSVDGSSPDVGTKFIGDMGSLSSFLYDIGITNSLAPVVLDVGQYMDLGPLGLVLPNPLQAVNSLANYIISPIRNIASTNLRTTLKAGGVNIPIQVSFR